MKQLTEVLSPIQNGAELPASSQSLSVMPQPLSIRNDLTTTTDKMLSALQPRETVISPERARQGIAWLAQLKRHRKTKRLWDAKMETWIYSSVYNLPPELTDDAVRKGLTELMRPCSPLITREFVRLQAFRPFYDNDPVRIDMVYQGLYSDIKALPEAGCVLALDDLRNCEEKYFPLNRIVPECESYRDLIMDCVDFLENKSCNSGKTE